MNSILGETLVLLSLFFAAFGAVLGFFAGYRHSLDAWKYARWSAYAFGGTMVSANFLMVYALVTHDFSISYVAEVGSRNTPLYFTVISLWSSLNGSILFWGGILSLYVVTLTIIYRNSHREYMPYTLGVLLSICVYFALLVASVSNPFESVFPVPLDGPGPNPLLQNHWLMAYHPPTLYLGYVGMAVPFAMSAAGLLAGRVDAGWVAPLRKWFLIPWTFLTMGILMGCWWSYEVLGWGGYWAWDPVENASFLPWLTGTAFLHSAMVLQRKGQLKTWTLLLGMATFLLTLLGTFMTRSGVFNSVHSFTQSDIGIFFLAFIAICFVFSVVLLGTRDHVLNAEMSIEGGIPSQPLGREFSILLQNIGFAVFTFVVLLGVLYPLITEWLFETRVSVGEPFFDRFAMPLGLLLVFLMGIGPRLPWGRMKTEQLLKKFGGPAGAGLLVGVSFLVGMSVQGHVLESHVWYAAFSFALCGFALISNASEFIDPVLTRRNSRAESISQAAFEVFRRGRKRFGGHIAHFGIIAAVVAITASTAFKVEHDAVLDIGESVTVGEWTATFVGTRIANEPHREAHIAMFDVRRGNREIGLLEPSLNFYKQMTEPIGTPKVVVTPTVDFYLSLLQISEDGKQLSVRAMIMPMVVWLWISAGIIVFGSLMVLWPTQRRELQAAPVAADAIHA